ISIARAILQNAEILILDDALSAVDGQTEFTILQNLSRWRQGRTLIISAHRLSALVEADNIIVLSQGAMVIQGRHEALISQTGWYKDMYHYQQIEAALDGDL
ncbi:multidrug ABC transporter permease/ATP-binding protein, partial [Bacillus aerophilus]|nr:multidrug ABC transporter permease/ATP-binding protein [Bacillus aerophilus]